MGNCVGVNGFDKYTVSRCGKVYSVVSGRALKPFVSGAGYMALDLYLDGKKHRRYVHRLVATAFLGCSELTVNHKDEDKTNNKVSNLEYMSQKDNCRYSNAKPVVQLWLGEVIKEYPAARATEEDGFTASSICKVIKGKMSHHKGYQWRYK